MTAAIAASESTDAAQLAVYISFWLNMFSKIHPPANLSLQPPFAMVTHALEDVVCGHYSQE